MAQGLLDKSGPQLFNSVDLYGLEPNIPGPIPGASMYVAEDSLMLLIT